MWLESRFELTLILRRPKKGNKLRDKEVAYGEDEWPQEENALRRSSSITYGHVPYVEVSSGDESEHPLISLVLLNVPVEALAHSSPTHHAPKRSRETLSDEIGI